MSMSEMEEHAWACAKYGDCIFDEVQTGAQDFESQWKGLTKTWSKLMDKAVKGGGWFSSPIADRRWLNMVLFQPSRTWPSGLSREQTALLKLAKAVSGYHPGHDQKVDRLRGQTQDPDTIESPEATLKVLQNYADLFKKKIAVPMWRSYLKAVKDAGTRISPLCDSTYGEPCSQNEAEEMFQGDLERGLKLKTLEVDPTTYRALPKFLEWVKS